MNACPPEIVRAIVAFSGEYTLALACRDFLRCMDSKLDVKSDAEDSELFPLHSALHVEYWAREITISFNRRGKFQTMRAHHVFADVRSLVVQERMHSFVARLCAAERFFANPHARLLDSERDHFALACGLFSVLGGKERHVHLALAIETCFRSGSLVVGALAGIVCGHASAVLNLSRKPDFDWWRLLHTLHNACPPETCVRLKNFLLSRTLMLTHHAKDRLAGAALEVFPPECAVQWMHVSTAKDAERALNWCWAVRPFVGALLLETKPLCREVVAQEPDRFLAACALRPELIRTVWRLKVLPLKLQRRLEVGLFTACPLDGTAARCDQTLLHEWVNSRPLELVKWTFECALESRRQRDVEWCWGFLRLQAFPFFGNALTALVRLRGWWCVHFRMLQHTDYQSRARSELVRAVAV